MREFDDRLKQHYFVGQGFKKLVKKAVEAGDLEFGRKEPEKAEYLQDILTPCSFIELKNYPLSAKTYLAKEIGFSIKARTRKNTADYISETELSELRQIKELSDRAMEFISK